MILPARLAADSAAQQALHRLQQQPKGGTQVRAWLEAQRGTRPSCVLRNLAAPAAITMRQATVLRDNTW